MIESHAERIGDDLLEGAQAIADELGIKKRRAQYLVERGEIPCFKLGNRWCARRSSLRRHFDQLERRANGSAEK